MLDTNPHARRAVLAVVVAALLVASTVAAGGSLTAVGTASAAPTSVDGCTTIDEPGVYELPEDVSFEEAPCIVIAASDVTFDGNGNDLRPLPNVERDPRGVSTYVAANASGPLTNVTVRDVDLRDVTDGAVRFANVSNGTVADVDVDSYDATALDGGGTVEVVGDRNTVDGVTGAYVSVVGDRNRVVDTFVAGPHSEGLSIDGDRNVARNVTGFGVTGFALSGNDNRVADSSVSTAGVSSTSDMSGVVATNTTGTVVSNVTATGYAGMVLENATNPTVRGSDLDGESSAGLVARASEGILVADSTLTGSVASGVSLVGTDGSTVRDTALVGIVGAELHESDRNTLRGNRIRGDTGVSLAAESGSNLVYDNLVDATRPVAFETAANAAPAPNTWNVSARPGENVVGGDTLGGNYYANAEGTGFGQTCEDTDSDGICDAPNELAVNNTDYRPLADPPNGTDTPDGEDDANATTYQIDFVAGEPIGNLSADSLYAQQDRLFEFAFGDTDEGITERGSAWPSESLRECVGDVHVESRDGDTAHVHFTVAEECENVTVSLVAHSLPGEEFDVDTVSQQELLNATTETVGPGEHTITIDLPGDGSDGSGAD